MPPQRAGAIPLHGGTAPTRKRDFHGRKPGREKDPLFHTTKKCGLLVLLLLLLCTGCRVGYLFHAAAGQFRLLQGAVPVE